MSAPMPDGAPSTVDKPILILVAIGIRSDAGSEPGKGWVWANALSKFYRLEILTLPNNARRIEEQGLPEGWRMHAVGEDFVATSALQYYPHYWRWCARALEVCRGIIRARPVAGLHHVILGSFRMLPRYDLLGIPYTLGPLGGGESIPWPLLGRLRLPAREIASEAMRLPCNYAFALLPNLRRIFTHARMTLATTGDSLRVVRALGARHAAVVFPDAFEAGGDDDAAVLTGRERQAATLEGEFRCVCGGRSLWWKGIHLAIDFVRLLRDRGINARLEIYSRGQALAALRQRAARLNLGADAAFHDMIGRDDLMKRYAGFHLFLNPTMHDSSSPALVEAYSTALPSMTLGLAGSATVATPETGLNARVTSADDWMEQGHRMVAGWIENPRLWLCACQAAKARARTFDLSYLERCVGEHLVPVFSAATRASGGS